MKCTKHLITITLVVFLIAFFCFTVNAHGGNTDSKGGHYDHQTNEYHYHHGYPEHSHLNGKCPYLISEESEEKKNSKIWTILFLCATPLIAMFPMAILICIIGPFFVFLSDKISFFEKHEDKIQTYLYVVCYIVGIILWLILILNTS